MTLFRTAAAIAAAMVVFLGGAEARGTGDKLQATPDVPSACARPASGLDSAGPLPKSAWSLLDSGDVRVRIAVGEGATAVNNEGGVFVQSRSVVCRKDRRD